MRSLRSAVGLLTALLVGCGGGGGGSAPTPAAPSISYSSTTLRLTTGVAVSLPASNTGGSPAAWSVTPALPAGLTVDASTGAIGGVVTEPMAPASYQVTASNSGGSDSVNLGISVQAVLLDLGATTIAIMTMSPTRVLTESNSGTQQWTLWNYSSGKLIAEGDACPVTICSISDVPAAMNIELAGPVAVVPYTGRGFQILSASDGSLMGTVQSNNPLHWSVARDGSYVCGGDAKALTVWATDGSVILSRAGDYSAAQFSCTADAVNVALGPAGSNVIETVTVPGGASTISPAFAGTFYFWFTDGSAFFTNVGNNIWIYAPDATQLDSGILPTLVHLGGYGQWFYTYDNVTLSVYTVGSGTAAPTATFPGGTDKFAASGPTLAILGPQLQQIDLSGAAPTETDYTSPVTGSYAAASASQWMVSNYEGVLIDGASLGTAPRYFGYGSAFSIAGSSSRLAVATATGKILIFDTASWQLAQTFDYPSAQLALSADGTVLASRAAGQLYYASVGGVDDAVRTIALPSGTVMNAWPYTWGIDPYATDITLSSSGQLLGQVTTGPGIGRQVTASTGGPALWSAVGSEPIRLSRDDTWIAASSGASGSVQTTTNIFLNGVLSTAVPGWSVTWLQNDDVLQNVTDNANNTSGVIFNSQGIKQTGPALPALAGPVQVLGTDLIYDAGSNAIYSLSTGAKTWSAPIAGAQTSAVAGSRVVFISGSKLVMEPY